MFKPLPPLLIWVMAHIVEALLFLRYYLLLPVFAFVGSRPSVTPKWAGELIYLQPSTLEYMRDVVIDDARAREVLGYVFPFDGFGGAGLALMALRPDIALNGRRSKLSGTRSIRSNPVRWAVRMGCSSRSFRERFVVRKDLDRDTWRTIV